MAASRQTVFHQRFCRASDCRILFFICSHCDRGQRYCSLVCRQGARVKQQRVARRRHQDSPEGRLDHRDRERAYRLRKAAIARELMKKSVTEHGSHAGMTSATMGPACNQDPEPDRSCWLRRIWLTASDLGSVVCHFCGRVGRFLNPFHESG